MIGLRKRQAARGACARVPDFAALERAYLGAPVNQFYKPRIRISEGECAIEIDVRPEFHHAMGAAHGMVLFKALDDAAFFAANSRVEEGFVLTADFHLHFLAPIREGTIRSVGRIVHQGRRQIVAEATATDDKGKLLARGSGTFAVAVK